MSEIRYNSIEMFENKTRLDSFPAGFRDARLQSRF
jgi:hypothetical protein